MAVQAPDPESDQPTTLSLVGELFLPALGLIFGPISATAWPLACVGTSILSGSDREGVNRRIGRPGRSSDRNEPLDFCGLRQRDAGFLQLAGNQAAYRNG